MPMITFTNSEEQRRRSAANTNNALRTLRRMLKKAHEWQLLSTVPVVKLVEEYGREELMEPWMEQLLLTVTAGARLTPKGRKSRVGWEPFRTVLLIMLDSGLRPGEIFRMRWENIHWDKGLIFNPRGKSRKSRRYVPLTERVKAALLMRKGGVNEGWVFPSKKAQSGHITDREVSKQWLEAKRLAGIPASGRLVLCSPSFFHRRDGGHWKCDGGHGCDGASISQYHAHLQPLECDADSGSNRAQESTVVRDSAIGVATKMATVVKTGCVTEIAYMIAAANGSATGNRTRV